MANDFTAKMHRAVDAWNTDNADLLDEAYAADILYHMPHFPIWWNGSPKTVHCHVSCGLSRFSCQH